MKPLHEDLKGLSREMQRIGERMEVTGRQTNSQALIDHGAELQNAAHQARSWVSEMNTLEVAAENSGGN